MLSPKAILSIPFCAIDAWLYSTRSFARAVFEGVSIQLSHLRYQKREIPEVCALRVHVYFSL